MPLSITPLTGGERALASTQERERQLKTLWLVRNLLLIRVR